MQDQKNAKIDFVLKLNVQLSRNVLRVHKLFFQLFLAPKNVVVSAASSFTCKYYHSPLGTTRSSCNRFHKPPLRRASWWYRNASQLTKSELLCAQTVENISPLKKHHRMHRVWERSLQFKHYWLAPTPKNGDPYKTMTVAGGFSLLLPSWKCWGETKCERQRRRAILKMRKGIEAEVTMASWCRKYRGRIQAYTQMEAHEYERTICGLIAGRMEVESTLEGCSPCLVQYGVACGNDTEHETVFLHLRESHNRHWKPTFFTGCGGLEALCDTLMQGVE